MILIVIIVTLCVIYQKYYRRRVDVYQKYQFKKKIRNRPLTQELSDTEDGISDPLMINDTYSDDSKKLYLTPDSMHKDMKHINQNFIQLLNKSASTPLKL